MATFKKIFYSFLIFFVIIMIVIVVAANSSFVIKKAADVFAPDYKISYDDIRGNILTGIKIDALKFDGKTLTDKVTFSWNPSKILYKRIAINEIGVEALDVDVVKALIDSFPASEDNSSSAPLPVVILVDKVHVDVKSFEEQGILISKTVLDVEDVRYASDALDVEQLSLKVESNVTNIALEASLDDGTLAINRLEIDEVDSVALEKMFLGEEENTTAQTTSEEVEDENEKEPLNPMIPKFVHLEHFAFSLKPRVYESLKIDKAVVSVEKLNANVEKIISNAKHSLAIDDFSVVFESSAGQLGVAGNMHEERVTLSSVSVEALDTLALQELLSADTNESNVTEDESLASTEQNSTEPKEVNHLIPKYIVINTFHTDVLPAVYEPVHINELALDIEDIKMNVAKLLVEKASIDLNGKTNLSNFTHHSNIKDNALTGQIKLTPNKRLFELYKLPLRKEAIGDIVINLDATEDEVAVDVKSSAKNILISQNSESNSSDANSSKAFNVDVDSLVSHIVYRVKENKLHADSKVIVSTPYAKDIALTNTFMMDENISYKGALKVKELLGIDENLTKPLKNLNIDYHGSLKSVQTVISADGLRGSFVSSDLKKGVFHLETAEALAIDKMVSLPRELNGTKVNVAIDVPLDFEKITPLHAKAKINSNISNIDADIMYGKGIEANLTSTIPDDSLLKHFDENVKWDALSPLVIKGNMGDKAIDLNLKSKALSSDIYYSLDNGEIDGKIGLAGLHAEVKGIAEEKITIKSNVNSIQSLLDSVQSLYTIEGLPPVEGALNLSAEIINLEQAKVSLASPKIIYHADHKTAYALSDVKFIVAADKSKVQLDSYNLVYDGMQIFSTKPSLVKMQEENIEISELWLNDQLKVTGTYNMQTRQGDISADAKTLHIAHKMIELDSAVNIQTVLNEERTSIKGKVILLGGNIHYDMSTKSYPSDSDILIVQEMKEDEASPFMENLSALVEVKTKKPLVYKQGPIDIKIGVDLAVNKAEKSELMVLGEVYILKGGSYTFEGKRFVLDKSNIYFTGNPSKPLLDMSVKYKSLNHLITIGISGTPATPNITFSSVPSLNKEQILSIILFDSEEGAGTNSGEDMMKMMGGAMAKSALNDLGIQLDHLAIGSDGSVEVGKKITDKITFIYVNDEIPQVRVKYQHSSRLGSVLSADEESQAYDIVYKRDFSEDDIVIFGK
ncbi:MAG: translocation/assembly module TamB domain-containing protein [Campylobacterota bacterium]|nr:translocation/assembly module TamB domain-containing protein [Campylobacterota bacterium]